MTAHNLSRNTAWVLKIKKRSINEWMVLCISLWPFLMNMLLMIPGIPGIIKYIADGILLIFALLTFLGKKVAIRRSIFPFVLIVGLFFVYTLLTYLVQYQSAFYYLWGFRNNFRGYLAFFIYLELSKEQDVHSWYRILDILFWINLVVSLIQFFFLGVRQDYLGGVFGIEGGTNGYTQIFMCIVIAKSMLCYQEKKESGKSCLTKCVASLLVAAMAELKFYFVLFVLLLIMTGLLTRFSWRKILVYIGSGIAIIICVSLLEGWFGFKGFLSIKEIWRLASKPNYASARDLNRLSAISTLSKTIVTHPLERLFGLGLGNCDTSSFAIFNTPFYRQYSYLHYTWFTAPMIFLETGYIGLMIYLLFFVITFKLAQKRMDKDNLLLCKMAMIMSVLGIIFSFYNSTLRIEAAYMIYYVLAAPFIKRLNKERKYILTS